MNLRPQGIGRDVRRWIPGLIVSLLLIVILLQLTSWEEAGAAITAIDPLYFALAALIFLISMVARAFAWHTILQGKASVGRVLLVINEGYLLNNIFPLRLGEFGRALLMGQSTGLSPLHVLSTIVIERAFDLFIAACLLIATIPMAFGDPWAQPAAIITLAVILLGLVALYLAARYQLKWRPRFEAGIERWPAVHQVLTPRLDSLLDGLGALTNPTKALTSFGFMLISWGLAVVEYFVILRSFFPDAPFWHAGFVLGAAAVGVALPSAPAALGVFEGAIVGALILLGVQSRSTALVYAVSLHLVHFTFTGVIGLFGLAREGQTLSGLYQQVRNFQRKN